MQFNEKKFAFSCNFGVNLMEYAKEYDVIAISADISK